MLSNPPITRSQRRLLKILVDAHKRKAIARAHGVQLTLAEAMDYTPPRKRGDA